MTQAGDFAARLNEQEQQRYNKLARLAERGITPFPLRASRTHTAREAIDAFTRDGSLEGVQLAGRLVSLRDMGKLTFGHLEDGSARIQLLFRRDVIGPENQKLLVKEFDLGDFVGVQGTMIHTKTGEVTLEVARFELLAKTLSPLPEKWHGLKD